MVETLATLGVVALVLLVAAAAYRWWPRREDALQSRVRRQAVVTMKAPGGTYQGLLWEYDDSNLVLREAEAFGPSASHVPVDGELLLRWADVEYVQLP